MKKLTLNLTAAVLLQYAAGKTLHELGIDDASMAPADVDCNGPDDPACIMFTDGFDSENKLGEEYYHAYHEGLAQGQQACANEEAMELPDINSQCNVEIQIDGNDFVTEGQIDGNDFGTEGQIDGNDFVTTKQIDGDEMCLVKAYGYQSGYANGYMVDCPIPNDDLTD